MSVQTAMMQGNVTHQAKKKKKLKMRCEKECLMWIREYGHGYGDKMWIFKFRENIL